MMSERSRTFAAGDGAKLTYHEDGDGEPAIVLVHGWQANASVWQPVVDRLVSSHRLISPDLRGFGESAGAPGPYTVEQFSADLAALTRALDLGRVVVVGHSMGGAIAQRFAIDNPDAVAGLVLIAPVPASGLAMAPRTEALFRAAVTDPEVARKWLRMLTMQPLPDERFELIAAAAAGVPERAAVESFESWTQLDFADEARTIGVPTLVIAGEGDRPQTTDFLSETVVEVIPGARMTVVESAGHYVQLEHDEHVAALIVTFAREIA
jgi:non-heme chloroperoxidase